MGVFDVLGFKNFVAAHSLDEVIEAYEGLVAAAAELAQFRVVKVSAGKPGSVRVDTEHVLHAIGSDTLFLWQAGARGEDVQNFFDFAAYLVAASVQLGLPLRGGIAFGECVMDREKMHFLGQPIIDAHLVETTQEWAGVALHDSCFESPLGKKLGKIADFVEYAVPVKEKCKPLSKALRWHAYADPNLVEQLGALSAKTKDGSSPHTKLQNTIAFVEGVPREDE